MNTEGFAGHLRVAQEKLKGATEKSMELIAQEILSRSMQEVPHETGDLQSSGRVRSDETRAVVSYDTPYAIRQHEDMTYHHDAGRKAKYLEDPFNEVFTDGTAEKIIKMIAGEALK